MTRCGPALLASVAILTGCIARGEPVPGTPPPSETGTVRMADSLVLTGPGGATVWLTQGRPSADAAGIGCVERSLEIRRDSVRVMVPLLYTVTPPVLLNDTTIRAELSEHCRPTQAYRVNLRTGMPIRITEPNR